jgi:hypothetical protein
MFSSRLPWSRVTNRLTRALEARRAAGGPILDLTASDPTRAGLPYPGAEIGAALAAGAAAPHEPAPLGLPEARAAVAARHAARGYPVPPGRVVLTAGTSEAYAFLFKVLADPGDAVLVPRPSYPLFEYLAALESVRPVPYDLEYDGRWRIDRDGLRRRAESAPPPRALVVVNPNNPTGSALDSGDRAWLLGLCAGRGLPVIADEVFLDYPAEAGAGPAPAGGPPPGRAVSILPGRGEAAPEIPVFALGGLSKSCGLPHLKLGWIAVAGPPGTAAAAVERLELVADTYLSVATPVQRAAARLLDLGEGVRASIRARLAGNRETLRRLAGPGSACRVLESDGGWYAVLRVPAVRPEEELVLELLERDGVLVHPGYFFDFSAEAFLILSLLPPPAEFDAALARVLRRAG